MPLKLKFFSLFLFISLVPLVFVEFFAFRQNRTELHNRIVNQLESVALAQEKRINDNIDRYLEQIKLITSRTQLRNLLAEYKTDGTLDTGRINEILNDAKNSAAIIEEISIINLEGIVISSTNPNQLGENKKQFTYFAKGQQAHVIDDIFKDEQNILKIRMIGPLYSENELIGIAEVIADSTPIISVTEDYTGLGKTGEMSLVKKNKAGDAVFITPLRFDAGAALNLAIPKERTNVPSIPAILGQETFLGEKNTVDYRAEPVFAITRFIEPLDWGIVLKIDQKEALAPISELLKIHLFIFIITTIIVGLISFILAKTITEPIRLLTLFAQNLQAGNFSMRTEVKSKGEIGYLTKTLNTMAEKLQKLYGQLEKKVKERTSELEQEKKKFEGAFESSAIGIALVSPKGKWLEVNDALPKIVGYNKAELLKMTFQDITHPDDLKKDLSYVKKMLKGEIKNYQIEKRYIHKNGYPIWILLSVSSVKNSRGKIQYFVSQIQDISKQKEIDLAKTEFVSLASHQLRTPLSAINWYAEMMLEGDTGRLNKNQKKYIEEIYHGNQRMVELVNSLLNVSRLELGTFTIEPKPTKLSDLASEVIKELKPEIKKRSLRFTKKYESSVPKVNVDPKLTRMIFQNLLSNAVKYTPEKGIVSLTISMKDKSNILITVKDNGYGIANAQQSKIFSKLFRADNVKEMDTEGTGLGLYIIHSIIDKSGGKIWFESKEGTGSTFYVSLPIKGMRKKKGQRSLS